MAGALLLCIVMAASVQRLLQPRLCHCWHCSQSPGLSFTQDLCICDTDNALGTFGDGVYLSLTPE